MPKKEAAKTPRGFVLNAAADIPDLRDRMYEPPLIKLEEEIEPDAAGFNIRHQGTEGACTGFALAAAIDLLNSRRGHEDVTVSARMLYEMAKRFDEWTGEDYEGSSLRGAIRGWWHNGVCPEELWPYKKKADRDTLTVERSKAAHVHALGAYYRLRPNLTDFHAALNETGVLCASARVHSLHDPTEGGLATGLREVASASGLGVAVEEGSIPVLAECREICRALRLDPLGLLASGALLITLPASDVPALLAGLEKEGIVGWEIGLMIAAEEGMVMIGPEGEVPLPEFPRDELARYFSATE